MLTQICQYLRNWFERDKIFDTFAVVDGVLTADTVRLSDVLQDGQYYRIVGSVFNDGVHKWGGTEALTDERSFSGAVWSMAIPPDVVALSKEIPEWIDKYSKILNSPFQSESKADYSYSKSNSGNGASTVTWQDQFRARLAPWRKI